MNTTELEVAAITETAAQKAAFALQELQELQLAMIGGGGGGETILA